MAEDLNIIEEKIYQLAKPYLATRDNDTHTQNALDFVLRLLKTGKGDRRVAVPAIILHDVGWSKVPEDIISMAFGPEADMNITRIHEEEGVKIAANILNNVGYNSSQVAEILQIIDNHDTRENPISINDEIVRDADKLTRYSKCFWFFIGEFGMIPQEALAGLESFIEQWFFLTASKEIAREELKHRQREIEQSHLTL